MAEIKKSSTLEEEIVLLQQEAKARPISIADILHTLSNKGRPLVLILLCLPFCQPLQIPGLSTPFGLAIAFFGFRMAFGNRIWLPKSILAKQIKTTTLEKITQKVLLLIKKTKRWIHPRICWLCRSPFMKIMNGVMIFLLGLLLALPLPIPLSNLAPAWSIFFIGIGTLEDDGIFILLGYLTFLLAIAFYIISILSIKKII